MISTGSSPLSMAAAALYCGVAVLCWLAGSRAAKLRQNGTGRWQWTACCSLFILLALSRWLQAEHHLHDMVRALSIHTNSYDYRQKLQAPLAVILALLALLGAGVWVRRWKSTKAKAPERWLLVAHAAAMAMMLLVFLRVISWHATDTLLYGLRLNWVLDPLSAMVAGWAALKYRTAVPAAKT